MAKSNVRAWAPGYLYHVTLYRNLPMIAEQGLMPGTGGMAIGASLKEHSKGKVFLCTWAGIRFWAENAIEIVEGNNTADSAVKDGLIPVLLRVAIDNSGCVRADMRGWRDSCAEAFETRRIDPEFVELYMGRGIKNPWLSVGVWGILDLLLVVDPDASPGYHFINDIDSNDLFPKKLPVSDDWCST